MSTNQTSIQASAPFAPPSTSSGACPTFFWGLCQQASRSRDGYRWAAYELARHARDLAEGDVDDADLALLDDAVNRREARDIVLWMMGALPRCMALVPARRRWTTFLSGIQRALNDYVME
jgi:hypothetical protein